MLGANVILGFVEFEDVDKEGGHTHELGHHYTEHACDAVHSGSHGFLPAGLFGRFVLAPSSLSRLWHQYVMPFILKNLRPFISPQMEWIAPLCTEAIRSQNPQNGTVRLIDQPVGGPGLAGGTYQGLWIRKGLAG